MKIRVLLILLLFLLGAKANAQTKYSDMELEYSVTPGPYSIGDTVTYHITLRNLGPDNNTDVQMHFQAFSTQLELFELPKQIYHYPIGQQLPTLITPNYLANFIRWRFSGTEAEVESGKGNGFPKGDSAVYTLRAIIKSPLYVYFYVNAFTLGKNLDSNSLNNSVEKSLCVTPPKPGSIRGNKSLCINSTGNVLEVDPDEDIDRYKWTLPEGWTITGGYETNRIVFSTNGVQADWVVSVRSINFCGESKGVSTYNVTTVAVPPPMPKAITGSSEVCTGLKNLSYSIEEVPGAVSYTWTLPSDWTIGSGPGTNSIKVNVGSASGTIKVVAVNGCGGSASRDLAVIVSPDVPAAPSRIIGDAVVCANTGTATYTVDDVPNAIRYEWKTQSDWDIISGQGTKTIVLKPGTGKGKIEVKASNACGTSKETTFDVLGLEEKPVLGAITGSQVFCASDANQTYSVAEVVGIKNYTWSVPTGWSIVSGQGTNRIVVKTGTTSGAVSLVGTGVCNDETRTSINVTVSTQAPAAPSAIRGSVVPCVDQEFTYTINAVNGATEYFWSVPSDWVIISGQGGTSLVVKVGRTPGQVSVYAKNACSQSAATTLAVNPSVSAPAVPRFTGETMPCVGRQVRYTLSVSSQGIAYTWQVPAGWSIVSGQGTGSITVTVGANAGQIKVTATNGCGTSSEASLAVTPSNGVPPSNFVISGPQALCSGNTETIKYSVSEVPTANAFQWRVPTGWTIVSGQGTPEISVKAGSASGNVSVSAQNGCGLSATKDFAVTVSAPLVSAPAKINGLASICSKTETTYSIEAVSGALSYQWTVPADWTVKSGQGTTSLVVVVGSAGTVSVRANNGCGASPAASLNVAVSNTTLVAGNITGETAVCAASNEQVYTIPAVTGATAYRWTVPTGWTIISGQNTRSIRVKVTSAGSISVAIENSCGTGASSSLAVTLSNETPATPSAITYSTNGNNPCAGQSNVTYSVNAVAGANDYVWTVPTGWTILSGQGTRSITVRTGTTAGQVTVAAKNNCGQSAASTVTVTPVQSVPVAPAGIAGETVPCIGKQQVYSVKNPSANIRYDWVLPSGWSFVSGQGTETIAVLVGTTAGQVKVTTSNSCGSSAEASLAVTPNNGLPSFTSTIDGPKDFCTTTNTSVTYSISPASGASAYQWVFPTGWTIVSGQGTPSVTVKPGSGSGEVQVSASNGCGQTTTQRLPVSVSSGGPATPGSISGTQNVCANTAGVAYSVTEVAGATSYVWEVPASWTITSGQNTNSIVVRTGQSTGQVRVSAKNDCGTSAASVLNVNMSETSPAKVGPIAGDNTFCYSDQQRIYSVPEATGTKDYVWSVPTGWTIVSGQNSRSITVRPNSNSGYVRVVAVNYCSSTRDSVMVTVDPVVPVVLGSIQGEAAPCQGQEGVVYSVNAVAGVKTYTWTLPSDWTVISGAGTNSIRVITGKAAGTISVVAATACAVSEPVTMAVSPVTNGPAVPTAIIGKREVCAGEEQTYTVESPVAGMRYNWTAPQGWTIVSGNGSSTLVVRVGTASGSLSVIAQNSCGSSSAKTLAVAPSTAVPVLGALTGASDLCAGSTQTYSVEAASGPSTYKWVIPSGWSITSGDGTSTIQVKAGSASGNIEVTATNGCGQSTKKSVTVNVNAGLQAGPGAITGDKDVCAQKPEVVYSVAPVAGATGYDWKVPYGWYITKGNGTSSITVRVGTTGGKIAVAAKNACNSTPEAAIDVTISSSLPTDLGPITGPDNVCSSQRFTYTIAAVTGATNYNWTIPNGWVLESGQGTRSITVVAGTYSGQVSVVAQNGCGNSSNTSTKQVQSQNGNLVRPTAIQTNSGNTTPCANQEGLVFKVDPVVGATSYEWTYPADWKVQSGQGTNSITFTAGKLAGTISVVAKNNCSTTESRTITVTPKDGAPVIAGDIVGGAAVCGDNTAVTYQISNVTGADAVTWSIPTGWTLVSGQNTTTLVVIPKTSGTLVFTATNTCGGSSKKDIQVVVNTSSELPISALAGPKEFCLGASQVYEIASIAGATYTWQIPADWQVVAGGGTNKVTLAPKKAGAAEVKVTVSNACGKSFTSGVNVTVAPALQPVYEITDESTACVGYQFSAPSQENVTYTWTIVSGGAGWSISEGQGTNRVKLQSPAGGSFIPAQIKCEVKNAGCSMTSQVYDIVPTPLAPEMSVPNAFSPNNDGKNDLWQIENLESYPVNEVVILNRWGSEVFRQRGYKNDWNGGGLAEGTYFYYVKVRLCEGNEVTLKGYVMLMR